MRSKLGLTFELGIMQKLQQEHYFMRINLSFEQPPDFTLDGTQLKAIVLHALQGLHGQVGAAIPVDILKCSVHTETRATAILRVPHQELVKIWSALTLLGSYGKTTCAFSVEKVSASLLSLATDSRKFQFSLTDADTG